MLALPESPPISALRCMDVNGKAILSTVVRKVSALGAGWWEMKRHPRDLVSAGHLEARRDLAEHEDYSKIV